MSEVREAIRKAIQTSRETRCRLSKETGIDQSQLSRLMSGQLGLSLDYMARLADALGLEIVVRPRRKGR